MLDANQIAAIETAMEEEHRLDREALKRLRRFLPANGHTSTIPAAPIRKIRAIHTLPEEQDEYEAITIIDKVEQVMQSDPHKKWSVPSMVAHLQSIRFTLQAKKPEATMGLVFGKLARKRKTIVRVRKGSGRTPSLYRGIPREHQEDASSSSDSDQNEQAAS